MQGDKIRLREQCIQSHKFGTGSFFGVQVAVVLGVEDLHRESARAGGDGLANAAKTDDAQRGPMNFRAA